MIHATLHRDAGTGAADARRPVILILTATAVLVAHYYIARPDVIGVFSIERGWTEMTVRSLTPTGHFLASLVLLGLVPVAVGHIACGLTFREMGLGFGNWREGLVWMAVGLPIAVFSGWTAGGQPGMRAVYPLDPHVAGDLSRFVAYALSAILYYGSWEALFRGVLLFGLLSTLGSWNANGVQTGMSVTAHFGRDLMETASAIPGGLIFGLISLRVKSIWYVVVIHWAIGMSTEWFAAMP